MVRKIKGNIKPAGVNINGLAPRGSKVNIDGSKLLEFRTIVNENLKDEDNCIVIYTKDKYVYDRITNEKTLLNGILDKLYGRFPFLESYPLSYSISDIGYINHIRINHKLKKNFNELLKGVSTVSVSLSNFIEED